MRENTLTPVRLCFASAYSGHSSVTEAQVSVLSITSHGPNLDADSAVPCFFYSTHMLLPHRLVQLVFFFFFFGGGHLFAMDVRL